jgi:hypothetical protein
MMMLKKYNIFSFISIILISALTILLVVVDADYIIYVDNLNKVSVMSFIDYINEIEHEYGYNVLLYIYYNLGISSSSSFIFFSNLILYFLIGKIVYRSTSDCSFKRQILIFVIILSNPLFFVLSVNTMRQLLSYSLFYFVITSFNFRNNNNKIKYLILIIPLLIHMSSFILLAGYLIGSSKKLENRIILFIACFIPVFLSNEIYNYYNLNLFHYGIYDPPKIYLIIFSFLMLIYIKSKKIGNNLFYSLYLPIALTIGLYDLTEFSHRSVLIIHFIYLFFIVISLKKINIRIVWTTAISSVVIFITYFTNYIG